MLCCCFTTDRIYSAEMAKALLESYGIESVILNKKDSVLLVGDIEVLVNKDEIIRAKHLLKDFEN